MRTCRILLASIASLALAGCNGEATGVTREDARARMRWIASAPNAYEFTLGRSCFCGGDYNRPVVVSVRNGAVEALRYEDDGAPITLERVDAFPTIDGLFAIIEAARARPRSVVTVQYHPGRGYPVNVALDFDTRTADDESWYSVRSFVAR